MTRLRSSGRPASVRMPHCRSAAGTTRAGPPPLAKGLPRGIGLRHGWLLLRRHHRERGRLIGLLRALRTRQQSQSRPTAQQSQQRDEQDHAPAREQCRGQRAVGQCGHCRRQGRASDRGPQRGLTQRRGEARRPQAERRTAAMPKVRPRRASRSLSLCRPRSSRPLTAPGVQPRIGHLGCGSHGTTSGRAALA